MAMRSQSALSKLIFLSAMGSCFELFDFLSFIFLSKTLALVFFPLERQGQGLIYTLAIFSTGYFFRPIGGLVLAHLGDRYGRKNIFILTLSLMSLPSLVIALMPTAEQIGLAAPLLLALMRMLQGISLGGEVAGSTTYVAEFSSKQGRAFACSLISAAANLGVILAALSVSLLSTFLTAAQLVTFGWRLPFLLGAFLGLLAAYLRKYFSETPLFLELKKEKAIQAFPLKELLKKHKAKLLLGGCLSFIVANTTSTFHLFFPTYLTQFQNYPTHSVFLVSIAGIATLAFCSPLFALSSAYWGRLKQCLLGSLSLVLICGLYSLRPSESLSLITSYQLEFGISIAIALVNSVLMAILADLFPTALRFSGVAFAYNVGCLAGAGLTPFINTYLIQLTGYLNTPFALVTATSFLTSIFILRQLAQKSLS